MVSIKAIEYYLPATVLTNSDMQAAHPDWDLQKVSEKSGVYERRIAAADETAFDLACKAVEQLFNSGVIDKGSIQGIIFCTQSPDYIMPSNAFLIHQHFGFGQQVWAFDYNLACSGFIYGLAIARGMIETKMAENVLLITADTYSKYLDPNDRSTNVLFGDGAAATLITNSSVNGIIDIELASAGSEYKSFYIPAGGCRSPLSKDITNITSEENKTQPGSISMNGFGVWKFISRTVPEQIKTLLKRNNLTIDDIQFLGFHQASKMTLDSLYKALAVPPEKCYMNMGNIGNTVSASIPIAIKDAEREGKLQRNDLVLLSGFGVGLSWGSLIMRY